MELKEVRKSDLFYRRRNRKMLTAVEAGELLPSFLHYSCSLALE